MKKADNFDATKWLVENKITFQSRLNENKIPGVDVEVDDDMITLSGDSGDYDGFIEDDGTVSFSVVYEDEDDRDGMEFDDENWKGILGDDHVFVKIAKAIPTKVEALDDYVMITVKADDLTSMNESKVKINEDLTDEIAALPNHHTAADPAEVAAFLKKNESLNEVENLPTRAEMFDDFEKMAQDLEAKTGAKIRTVHFPNQFRFDVKGDMMGWWDGQFDVPIARRNLSAHIIKQAYDAVNKWVANFPAQYKDYLSWKAKGEEAFDQEVNRRRKEFFGN